MPMERRAVAMVNVGGRPLRERAAQLEGRRSALTSGLRRAGEGSRVLCYTGACGAAGRAMRDRLRARMAC